MRAAMASALIITSFLFLLIVSAQSQLSPFILSNTTSQGHYPAGGYITLSNITLQQQQQQQLSQVYTSNPNPIRYLSNTSRPENKWVYAFVFNKIDYS